VGRVVLHVGAMKTGTSFVQSILFSQRDVLDKQDVALLGGREPVIRAIQGVINPGRWGANPGESWSDFAAKAKDSPQTLIASMEFLSFANDEQVAEFVEPFAGVELDIVVTVRDEFRAIPAQWQSYCRSLGTSGWARYLRQIAGPKSARRSMAFRTFRRARGIPAILERWHAQPGVSSVHAVIVPRSSSAPDELWNRFCTAARIDAAPFRVADAKSNASLGYGSCDFLRRMNSHLDGVDRLVYRRVMRTVAPDVLGPLREDESRPGFDSRGAEFATSRNQQMIDTLGSGRFVVHGDLAELSAPERPEGYPDKPARAPRAETKAAAAAMWTYLTEKSGKPRRSPKGLDNTIEATAKLMRRMNGW
jgi:hypothetical protein